MAVQIQMRRDTAAAWLLADPTLAEGEFGKETDTDKWKNGNGIDIWSALPYILDPTIPAFIPDLPGHPAPPASGVYAYRFAATGEVWYMGPAGIPSLQAIIL
jgi:hypothetical protein